MAKGSETALPASAPALPALQQQQTVPSEASLRARIQASGLFDPAWYLGQHEDVGASALDPLTHYLRLGWRRGYNPSAHFDSAAYATAHPEAGADGRMPLEHYLSRLDALSQSLKRNGQG